VSADNPQGLFVKAGLGKLGHNNKFFSFQHASKFESFCSMFMIQDARHTTHSKVKGLKTKQWLIRLGTHYIGDLRHPTGTKGHPPPVKNIQTKQRNFQHAIAKLPPQWQHTQAQVEETNKSNRGSYK
jgi:hypothetical protein